MRSARLAGFATRALALMVDVLILDAAAVLGALSVVLIAQIVGLQLHAGDPAVGSVAGTAWALGAAVYLVGFWRLTGQTPGMRILGIRVIRPGGERLTLGQSLRRLVGMVLAAIPLGAGFLLVLVDDRRRGLHDRVAGTLVIHEPGTQAPAATPPAAAVPVFSAPVAPADALPEPRSVPESSSPLPP